MPTLRRILKYTPAVVLGLLVVASVFSVPRSVGYSLVRGKEEFNIHLELGSVGGYWFDLSGTPPRTTYSYFNYFGWEDFDTRRLLGKLDAEVIGDPLVHVGCDIPIPLVATTLLPLAIGPFLSFRFRLWHYLAYTALIAVELAYYLRWQE